MPAVLEVPLVELGELVVELELLPEFLAFAYSGSTKWLSMVTMGIT